MRMFGKFLSWLRVLAIIFNSSEPNVVSAKGVGLTGTEVKSTDVTFVCFWFVVLICFQEGKRNRPMEWLPPSRRGQELFPMRRDR